VWGMPRSVTSTGIVDAVVPLADIATTIQRAVRRETV
jgi:chemotaxis response regulator CheB